MYRIINIKPDIKCLNVFAKIIPADGLKVESLKKFFEKEIYNGNAVSEDDMFKLLNGGGKIKVEIIEDEKKIDEKIKKSPIKRGKK